MEKMEHRMISSLIINNDMLHGGRFKRFPSLLIHNTDTNICVINGGYVTLDSSAKIITETNKSVITVPGDPTHSPFHCATQNDLINTCVSAGSTPSSESVLSPPYGVTLSQVNVLLNGWLPKKEGWTVKANYVTNQSNKKVIKRELIKVLNGGTSRVLINYNRQMLGQSKSLIFPFLAIIILKFNY